MTIWIIRGACSGVGKTFVAKRLCAVLPAAVYAKLGHGQPKKSKSANFFTNKDDLDAFINHQPVQCRHIVVESNTYHPQGNNAIIVFLENGNANGDLRPDANELRRAADVCISADARNDGWLPALRKRLDEDLAQAVYGILAEQKRMLDRKAIAVRSKIWMINRSGKHVFGSGLASLIEDVEHLGSLSAAAENANMSYRHAWGAIKEAEKHLGFKLLLRSSGGVGGGGSLLTQDAKRLLALYCRLNETAAATADREFERFYQSNWQRMGTE